MRKQVIDRINALRIDGKPPSVIASALGISVNTVKSYIYRHPQIPGTHRCLGCGKAVLQPDGRKEKKFCSDRCRSSYWNTRYREGGKSDERKETTHRGIQPG